MARREEGIAHHNSTRVSGTIAMRTAHPYLCHAAATALNGKSLQKHLFGAFKKWTYLETERPEVLFISIVVFSCVRVVECCAEVLFF